MVTKPDNYEEIAEAISDAFHAHRDKANVAAIKCEILQPTIAAIRDDQDGFCSAGIHHQTVGTKRLPAVLAGATK